LDVHKQDVKNKLFKKNDGVPQSLQSSSLRAKKAKQTLAGKKSDQLASVAVRPPPTDQWERARIWRTCVAMLALNWIELNGKFLPRSSQN